MFHLSENMKLEDDHFPHYSRSKIMMGPMLVKMVRELRYIKDKTPILSAWYEELHEQHNRSRWWGTMPPIAWERLLSFQILEASPTLIALKFFLNDIYEKEKLYHTSIHFHHMVRRLAHHLRHIPHTIRPDDWLDAYYDCRS